MSKQYLVMKWDYEYDKESTWYDEASGVEYFELIEGACYPLPKENSKKIEIKSIQNEDDLIKVEVYVDYHTVMVISGQETIAHASNSYSVCGDSVHESWCLTLYIDCK